MRSLLQRFIGNEGGNFAIIMGLAIVPLVGLLGAAVDYSQLYQTKSRMQSAADTAILAAARDSKTVNEFYSLTDAYLAANLPDLELETVPKVGPKSVQLTVINKFEPSFMGLVGVNDVPVSVEVELAIEKFSRGSTGYAKETTGGGDQSREVIAELRKLRDQMLRSVDRLPQRHQAEVRAQIQKKFQHLIRQAASGGLQQTPVHLSK